MNKKMKSLKRILFCAENDMLSYISEYESKAGFCSIGCLFDKELLDRLWYIADGMSASALFRQYPGLSVDTGLSVEEANWIQRKHDNLRNETNRKSIFIKQVKSWIANKGEIV